ncbi:MAG: PTS mannose transporter subunit IID [Gemmatimonadota bacterium]|nr:PTS mannose transporter subunit IID [Gemmatimonadota bacterium]MDH5758705.1 PTS mannose transporter subunit IID [Gemmatimonadota bacterium]
MSETALVKGVVVAHGGMARGLIDAVSRIAGPQGDALVALSNEDKGPAELEGDIDALAGDDPTVIFVDLHSGSCGHAAFRSSRARGDRLVLCGVNLPALLDFVFHRDLPLADLGPRLVEKARDAVVAFPREG